ncbi:hypothetical protein A2841_03395 [Candidatus Kaiserbacteria bacterium RIFCSPHIGHO2_01_FULL_48_10]|uniref:Serine protease n=1 Tax=Candidatus Kaiserbacteria bacterium RIFCSPHIGHO2_01_FULL_48_10 TaxID=1798476 RepID=A0A1F6CC46_9BACT|nr:MAG: hypothetical protein A2841_03395 [Candidatus Kaiserbacteria bacterium RIFCSPHIGHO2_01_FULL_48_10]
MLGLSSQPAVVVAPSEQPAMVLETPQTEQGGATSTVLIPAKPEKKAPEKKTPVTAPTESAPPPPPVTSLAETLAELGGQMPVITTLPATQATNEVVRAALVNIVCTTEVSGPLNSISASGVIIHPAGVIMTNAHVGQYFLLKDYPRPDFTSCIIRTGSPAQPKYKAELLFLPPSWIEKNAQKIDDEAPTGNGEHDYALLRISGTVSSSIALPSAFPSVIISTSTPKEGAEVLVAGYPAGFLGGITIAKDLYAASSFARIGQIYTFTANTPDLFSIGGTVVAQQGSSGGAVADGNANMIGLITTSTQGADTASRDLRAVATAYIVEDFAKESGVSFETFLNGNLFTQAQIFNIGMAPTLTKALTNVLEGH